MRLIIVSGLSGSGKSIALHMLEDLDYYCTDNLPAALLGEFVSHTLESGGQRYERTAVGLDARNRPEDIAMVPQLVDRFRRGGTSCELIFLTADEDTLLKRYSDTRRKHPLSGRSLGLRGSIQRERELLAPIADQADLIIDTTRTNVHQLRELVRERVHQRSEHGLSLMFESFAYKHGVPGDADFVFDARSLPNPYWELPLREHTGRDAPVIEFLGAQEAARRMLGDIVHFMERWLPDFERTNRSYLTVAVGCTGGRHRSVYLVEKLAQHFGERYTHVLTHHNELPS